MPSSTTSPIDAATRDAVHAFLERISAEYPLHEAILFGSRAKGLARPDSDADVALILGGSKQSFMQTRLDMADTAFDIMLDTGVRIQPLPSGPDNGMTRTPGSIPSCCTTLPTREFACGKSIRPDGGLISAFGLHLVKSGKVDRPLGHTLNRAHEIRLIADYTGDLVDHDLATWTVEQARTFVDAMHVFTQAAT